MEDEIINEILRGNSVAIVGVSESGKTYWAQNSLLPRLKKLGKSVAYSDSGFNDVEISDVAVFDEVETLFDIKHLEIKYPEENPFYSEIYLKKVSDWYRMYTRHKEPTVYIISRREEDIQYLVDNFNKTDWDNRNLKVFRFPLF
ncbi:MAG: hypothetical protein WCO84_02085 [bacterium]